MERAATATVSIIVPCHNVDTFLQRAYTQLAVQSFEALEIILIDDASSDRTREKAHVIAYQDPRVRVVEIDENLGVAEARFAGLSVAKGEWIWMVDADDVWPSDALELLVAGTSGEVDVVVGRAKYVYESGDVRNIPHPAAYSLDGSGALAALLSGTLRGHLWNKLFRTSFVRSLPKRVSEVHSDLLFVAQALGASRRVGIISGYVYEYHLRSGSIIGSRRRRQASLAAVEQVIRECIESSGKSSELNAGWLVFRTRFLEIARLEDAVMADYSDSERRDIAAGVRSRIEFRQILDLVRLGQLRLAAATFVASLSVRTSLAVGRYAAGARS